MAERHGEIYARAHKLANLFSYIKNLLYLCTRKMLVCHKIKRKRPRRDGGAFFLLCFSVFIIRKYEKRKKKKKK